MGRLFVVLLGLAMAYGLPTQGQTGSQEEQILQAIRSGRIKVTDDLIEEQKRLHPEFEKLSNDEIRQKLNEKGAVPDSGAKPPEDEPAPNADKSAKPTKPAERAEPTKPSETQERTARFPAGIERFGYEFFSNNPNAGMGGGNIPALPDYILSPGDEIQIYTWGRENQNQVVVVDNEGMIRYPPLPPTRVAGLKFEDAQQLLTREIEKISGMRTSVGLGKLKSIRVFVLGEAANPGSYVVPAGATVTTALFQSGGIRPIGSLRGIQLKRNGKIVATLDLYEMLLKGNNRTDQQLLPGDAIFIPVAPIQVALTGMVKRTGIYEVKPGTKVLEALELAGGLSSNAFKGRVRLDRIESHKRKVVLDVGMEKMGGNANVTLQDGDILNVEEVLSREYDVVYLEGNVNRPGRYEYKKGMTIRDLIPGVKDLKSETFFNYGHIKRSSDDDQGSLLLPFSLKDVFESGTSVPLAPRDTVIVYSKFDIMDQPEVKIAGIVRRPGRYPFVEKMRISDLIINGGGLSVDAYLPEAHLIRTLKSHESDSLFSTLIKINLSVLLDNPGDGNNVDLRPSDSLIIFPRTNFILPKWVSITGAVKKNGVYELTQNMGIPELISQADGLTNNTYKLRIEVVRRIVEKDSVVRREIQGLSLKAIMEGATKFVLQDGDRVYVREVVNHSGSMVVSLTGEYNFPGKYEASKGERLSNIVKRAGGFTDAGYLRAGVLIRKSVKERQLLAIDDLERRLQAQLNNLLSQTTNEKDRANIQAAIGLRQNLIKDIREAPYLGRVVVGLNRDYIFPEPEQDIIVEDGDSIYVPAIGSTISIMGEVFSPTNLIVSASTNTVGKCLSSAGGVNEYGDGDNIYYIRPDGSVLTPKNVYFFKSKTVEPGGVIVVPPKGPRKDYLDALAKVTQIIYQIAISVGVAITVF